MHFYLAINYRVFTVGCEYIMYIRYQEASGTPITECYLSDIVGATTDGTNAADALAAVAE